MNIISSTAYRRLMIYVGNSSSQNFRIIPRHQPSCNHFHQSTTLLFHEKNPAFSEDTFSNKSRISSNDKCEWIPYLVNVSQKNEICQDEEYKIIEIFQRLSASINEMNDVDIYFLINSLSSIHAKNESIFKNEFARNLISNIDDLCVEKLKNWNIDFTINILYAFAVFRKVENKNNFIFYSTKRVLGRKLWKYDLRQLIKVLLIVNRAKLRNSPFLNSGELCVLLEDNIDQMKLGEVILLLDAINKQNAKFKNDELLKKLYAIMFKNMNDMESDQLNVFFKFFRMSTPARLSPLLEGLLEKSIGIANKATLSCCSSIALLGTSLMIYNENITNELAAKLSETLSNSSINEIERALQAFSFFQVRKPDLFNEIVADLKTIKRQDEINLHPRFFASIAYSLASLNIFEFAFIDKVLSNTFLVNTYGKQLNCYSVPIEIIILDALVKTECPRYIGNHLNDDLIASFERSNIQKAKVNRINLHNQAIAEVKSLLENKFGESECFKICNVLPYSSDLNIIFRVDSNGNPTKLDADSNNLLSISPNEGNWQCVVPVRKYSAAKSLYGISALVTRHLRKMGFNVIQIPVPLWKSMTLEDKVSCVLDKVSSKDGLLLENR